MSAAEAETSSEGRTGSCMRGSLDAKVANECTNSLHGVWGVHVMHSYYACMHIMHENACMHIMHIMHACMHVVHAYACVCMHMHA